MRLLLIRHGETVDNVAGNYAGITDSALTNHGVLQAQRLGAHLKATGIVATSIFSSDLQRAFKTAEAIRLAQSPQLPAVTQLPILREQDFGFYEGKRFYERPKDSNKSGKDAHLAAHRNDPGFVDVESKEAMTVRAESFVTEHLIEVLKKGRDDQVVIVVAHGIILNHLWRAILRCFQTNRVTLAAGVSGADRGLEYLGGWSNTGYFDLEVKTSVVASKLAPVVVSLGSKISTEDGYQALSMNSSEAAASPSTSISATGHQLLPAKVVLVSPAKLSDSVLLIKAINCLDHLKGLKKARGGLGSLKHDSSQKTMDTFFKKRKTE